MHLYYDDLSNIDYLSVERERFPDWKFQHYCRDNVGSIDLQNEFHNKRLDQMAVEIVEALEDKGIGPDDIWDKKEEVQSIIHKIYQSIEDADEGIFDVPFGYGSKTCTYAGSLNIEITEANTIVITDKKKCEDDGCSYGYEEVTITKNNRHDELMKMSDVISAFVSRGGSTGKWKVEECDGGDYAIGVCAREQGCQEGRVLNTLEALELAKEIIRYLKNTPPSEGPVVTDNPYDWREDTFSWEVNEATQTVKIQTGYIDCTKQYLEETLVLKKI